MRRDGTLQHTLYMHCNTHWNRTSKVQREREGALNSTSTALTTTSFCSIHIMLLSTLQHIATHCNTPEHTAALTRTSFCFIHIVLLSTLQHTATSYYCPHCNTPQHTTTHGNIFKSTITRHSADSNTRQHTTKHCNTLEHTSLDTQGAC